MRLAGVASICFSLTCFLAFAQPRPRIDFDAILKNPNLSEEFEIRYLVRGLRESPLNVEMLRIWGDRRASFTSWTAEHPGPLVPVCRMALPDAEFRRMVELLRDRKFAELPSDDSILMEAAEREESIVSVRLEKLSIKKVDRHDPDKPNPGLEEIERALTAVEKKVAEDGKCKIEMAARRP